MSAFLDALFPTATPASGTPSNRAGFLESFGQDLASSVRSGFTSAETAAGTRARSIVDTSISGFFNQFTKTKTGQDVVNQVTQSKIQQILSNPITWVAGLFLFWIIF